MARRDVVTAVTGRLLEDDWGKSGRRRHLGNARNMARAAQGASPAFFKMIRTGGCSSGGQLQAQFNYLFSKSVDIHDSKGLLDHNKSLTPAQIDGAVARWAEDWKGKMNAARTTHMVMSFPRGANPRHVSLIAGEICREKLGGRFDYMIAIHADSKNPHAHIVVNRRGEQGEYFTLRHGTEYSYQSFKEAMVDHAKTYRIQLEATSRVQRGHVNYPPSSGQWQKAKKEAAETGNAFVAPEGKPRTGAALARVNEEIRDWSLRYRDLASFTSASNMQDLSSALEKAAQILADGGIIQAKGEPYMSVAEDYDRAASDFRNAVDRIEKNITEAAPNQRPAMERQLAEAFATIEHLQPLGVRSRELREPASEDGIYSAQNTETFTSRLTIEGRDKLTAALDGTGIDPIEVEARARLGATSAALESRWAQEDVQSVADLRGLDLRDEAQMQQAIEVVDAAYNRIAKDYGIEDAVELRGQGVDAIADYESRFPDGDTYMADGVGEEAYRQEQAELDAEEERRYQLTSDSTIETQSFSSAAAAGAAFADAEAKDRPIVMEAVGETGRMMAATKESNGELVKSVPPLESSLTETEREFWSGYHDRIVEAHKQADTLERAPTSSIGSSEADRHDLRQYSNPVGEDDERRLREAIERTLTRDELERLKRGDVEGLKGVGSRDEQLSMARDYLRSTNDPVAQKGLDSVNEQLAAEREHLRRQRGHEGGGHE